VSRGQQIASGDHSHASMFATALSNTNPTEKKL
jgi:hypothetical protein